MIPMHPWEIFGKAFVCYIVGYATCALIVWAKSRLP